MAKKKKEWRFKHTINTKYAKIITQSNHIGLSLLIQDAYDNAVRELNQKGEKAMNKQDKLHLEHYKVLDEHTEFMEKYRLLKIECKEVKKEKKMLQESLDQCQRDLLDTTEQRDRSDEALGIMLEEATEREYSGLVKGEDI